MGYACATRYYSLLFGLHVGGDVPERNKKKRSMGNCVGSIICNIALAQIPHFILFYFFRMAFKLCGTGSEWLLHGFINQHLTLGNPQCLEIIIKVSSPFG